ncbi:conserved hypothetical protein [Lebetimonas natsushimae]|uniref:Gcp-like domain-containing protein n=1 Tax=Lebetimonas natsushimae TaxID=1936991 RepID=A0A292YCP1_9BACT|nr:hypothetical protein [Lebetimonas natsushimae]GAX87105.1 conserved hypothetical protein [Lebetimonas natsushimae]
MQKPLVDVVAIVVSKPLKIGIYKNNKLIESIEEEGLTSDILPVIFDKILKKYEINSIIYSKGPGSFMSIKLSFVFFKTLQIAKGIKFLAADGFYFNKNQPIKAVGKSYFIKKEGIITLKKNLKEGEFFLPEILNKTDFSEDVTPLYVLNAV